MLLIGLLLLTIVNLFFIGVFYKMGKFALKYIRLSMDIHELRFKLVEKDPEDEEVKIAVEKLAIIEQHPFLKWISKWVEPSNIIALLGTSIALFSVIVSFLGVALAVLSMFYTVYKDQIDLYVKEHPFK